MTTITAMTDWNEALNATKEVLALASNSIDLEEYAFRNDKDPNRLMNLIYKIGGEQLWANLAEHGGPLLCEAFCDVAYEEHVEDETPKKSSRLAFLVMMELMNIEAIA